MTDQSTNRQDLLSIRDILNIRNYRWLWLGQIVSNFGDSLTMIALILLINRLTDGSASAIAGLLITLGIPTVTIGLVAGALVDRLPRKRVMLMADIVRGLLILVYVGLSTLAQPPIWALYLVAFAVASVASFFAPARMAVIPNIVPQNGLMAANSLGQISRVLFAVLGTSLAGFLIGWLGNYPLVFTIDALTFFLSALCIRQITYSETISADIVAQTQSPAQRIYSDIRNGMAILTSNRVLLGILLGLSVTMLGLGAINVLLPPLLVNELQVNEAWFGAIELSQSVGMILSGAFVTLLASRMKATNIISITLFFIGLVSMGFSVVSSVWHLFPILFAAGLLITPLQASASTLLQTLVEDSAMGRAGAALNACIQSATLFSMFAAGFLADYWGIPAVFLLGGAITALSAFVAAGTFYGQSIDSPHPAAA